MKIRRALMAAVKKVLRKGRSSATTVQHSEILPFEPRFGESAIHNAIDVAKNRFSNRTPIILTDIEFVDGFVWKTIRCDREAIHSLDRYSTEDSIFIYACDIDENGLPFVKRLIELGGKFIPAQSYVPSLYCNLKSSVAKVLREEFAVQRGKGYLKWGVGSFFAKDQLNLMQAKIGRAHV